MGTVIMDVRTDTKAKRVTKSVILPDGVLGVLYFVPTAKEAFVTLKMEVVKSERHVTLENMVMNVNFLAITVSTTIARMKGTASWVVSQALTLESFVTKTNYR